MKLIGGRRYRVIFPDFDNSIEHIPAEVIGTVHNLDKGVELIVKPGEYPVGTVLIDSGDTIYECDVRWIHKGKEPDAPKKETEEPYLISCLGPSSARIVDGTVYVGMDAEQAEFLYDLVSCEAEGLRDAWNQGIRMMSEEDYYERLSKLMTLQLGWELFVSMNSDEG